MTKEIICLTNIYLQKHGDAFCDGELLYMCVYGVILELTIIYLTTACSLHEPEAHIDITEYLCEYKVNWRWMRRNGTHQGRLFHSRLYGTLVHSKLIFHTYWSSTLSGPWVIWCLLLMGGRWRVIIMKPIELVNITSYTFHGTSDEIILPEASNSMKNKITKTNSSINMLCSCVVWYKDDKLMKDRLLGSVNIYSFWVYFQLVWFTFSTD